MAAFSLTKSDDAKDKSDAPYKSDRRRANKFFEHAQTVADARNYQYAIDCYINGLRYDPDNLDKHEALREVAMRRKVSGGKPASFKDKLVSGGKTPLERMLHHEKLLAYEPLNLKQMLTVMRHAADAHERHKNLSMGEVAYWIGSLILDINAQQKNDKSVYIKARDYFAQIGGFDKAVEACKSAIQLDPNNAELFTELKNLEAERTLMQGGYGQSAAKASTKTATGDSGDQGDDQGGGGFRGSVRDTEKQKALEQEERVAASASAVDEMIERARRDFDDDPQDVDKLTKLVDALLRKADADSESEAMELLDKAYELSGEYRFQVRKSDLQMRQYARTIKQLRAKLKEQPDNAELKRRLEQTVAKRLAFELQAYRDRVSNYPTDLAMKFELGKRLFQSGDIDEAIGMFQQATADARCRAQAHLYLGSCFARKQWYDEAIDTVREGIEAHKNDDDRLALELRYVLMDSLEHRARREESAEVAQQARKVASEILQTDINFRDIKHRMETLRKLPDELKG